MDGGIHSPSPVASVNGQVGNVELTGNDILPSQSGNSGKVLGTNGSSVSWVAGGTGNSPLTTKGDIYGYSTTDDRLPVGTNGQVLTADSSQSMGVKWSTPSGTGDMVAATYDPQGIEADAFDLDNMTEGTTNKSFTATEKTKLSGIASGAEVNVNADWNSVSGDSQILNKPTLGTAAATDASDYATAAQGTLADTALQSVVAGTNVTIDDTDPQNPVISASGGGGGAVDSVNGQTGTVVLDADDIDDTSTTNKFVTAGDLTKLSNTSGTNTGDQDLSGYATKTGSETLTNKTLTSPTINGGAISADTLEVKANSTSGSKIKFYEDSDNGSQSMTVKAPDAMGSDKTITFPLPTTSDVLVGESTSATLTGKTMSGSSNTFSNISADSLVDGSTNHVFTAADDTKLAGIESGADVTDSANVLAAIGYTPEDLSNKDTDGTLAANSDTKYASQKATKTYADTKVPKTTTVNGHALSSNVTVTKSDVSLGNVDNTSDANKPVSTAQRDAIDAQTNIYGDSYMRTFRAALADKSNTPVDMLFIGDSKTEGATVLVNERWIDVFRESFRAHNQPPNIAGGYGYIPAFYQSVSMTDPFTLSGSATVQNSLTGDTYGLGKRCVTMTSAGSMTLTVGPGTDLGAVTSIDVVYTQNSSQGVFSVTVDGGSATYVTATSATEVMGQRYSITPLSSTSSHTIVIAWFSGTVTIEGAMLYNGDESAGIRIWDSAHSNMKAQDVNDTTQKWWKAITTIQPQFVFYQLGRNDINNGISVASVISYMQNQVSKIRALCTIEPTIIIGMDWKDSLPDNPSDTYENWRAAVYDMVQSDGNLGLFDQYKAMGSLATSGDNDVALSQSDLVHATPKGHEVLADAFLAYLESFVESKREPVIATLAAESWADWTPTITNLSGGTLNYAVYYQVSKVVHFKLKYTLAGAGISGGRPTFTLPVTAASRTADTADIINAVVELRDANGSNYTGVAVWGSSTTISTYVTNVGSTYPTLSSVSSTVPFTWAASDYILIAGSYEAA